MGDLQRSLPYGSVIENNWFGVFYPLVMTFLESLQRVFKKQRKAKEFEFWSKVAKRHGEKTALLLFYVFNTAGCVKTDTGQTISIYKIFKIISLKISFNYYYFNFWFLLFVIVVVAPERSVACTIC